MRKVLKVPCILQMEAIECGAACLGMILAYHKKYLPLERLRIDCGVSRDGSNGKSIALAAQGYGLSVKALRLETDELHTLTLPAIIHWNFNHFVVLRGFTEKYAVINDPSLGTYKASYEELNRSFTGVAMTFEKTKEFKRGGVKTSGFSFLKKQSSKQGLMFILLLAISAVVGITSLMPSIYSKIFIDNIILKQNTEWLIPLIIAVIATLIVTFVAISAKNYMLFNIKTRLGIIGATNYFWHVLKLPINFFAVRFSSDIASRQNDYDAIVAVLCEKLIPIAINFAMLVFYLFFMLQISIFMTVTGACVICMNIITIFLVSKNRINSMRLLNREESSVISATESAIDLIETIKASGNERNMFAKWTGSYVKKNNAEVTYINMASKLEQLPEFLSNLSYLLILTMGIYSILDGNMTIGTFVAFQGLMALMLNPVADIGDSASKIQESYGKIERINDVFNYPVDSRYDIDQIIENEFYNFELIDVCFGYNPLSEPTVKNISFKINKGDMISIVGTSGSGKSTVYKLIAGIYEAWSGSILFHGIDIAEISRDQLMNSIAVVSQNTMMFYGSVWDNITLWDSSINKEDVIQAAKDANIHEHIMERTGGYNSMVLEEGRNFSGGQRQRLEIARALCKNPSILILDEATSALDSIAEKEIMDNIKRRGVTCLVISHRLSAVRDSNLILVMEDGEIIERGTHLSLMLSEGKYSKLIKAESGCDDDGC